MKHRDLHAGHTGRGRRLPCRLPFLAVLVATAAGTAAAQTMVGVPKVSAAPRPGQAAYAGRIELPDGQRLAFSTVRRIESAGDELTIVETARLPMGEVSDRTVLAKDSLVLRKRTIVQGPITVEFVVTGGRARGQTTVEGQPRPFDAPLDGDLFADGAGAHTVVAMLPLEYGYTTSFRNFDVQTQTVKVVDLKVVGAEQVTVPAGTFDALKVELSGRGESDKTTLWIDRKARELVKASAVVAGMNGAVITTELEK